MIQNRTTFSWTESQRASLLFFLSLVGAVFFVSCDGFKNALFQPDVPPDPCDPASSLILNGNQYIDRDLINQEGQMEPGKIFQIIDPANNPCDPLNKKEP